MDGKIGKLQLFWLLWLCVAQELGSIAFLIGAPQYKNIYAGFSVTLPPITAAIAGSPAFVWTFLEMLGAIQLVFFLILFLKKTYALRRAFMFVAITNLIIIAAIFVALYIPMFMLGSVV